MYSLIIICLSNRIQLLKFYFSVITLEPTFTKKNKKTCKNLRILIFNRQNCDAGKDSFKAAKASPVIYVIVGFFFYGTEEPGSAHSHLRTRLQAKTSCCLLLAPANASPMVCSLQAIIS